MKRRELRIAAAWKSYQKEVLPPDAPPIQISECRQAFYGGAVACYSALMNNISFGHAPTPADVEVVEDIQAEMADFFRAAAARARAEEK